MKRLAVEHPDEDKYLRPDFVPLLDGIVGESKRPLWILAGAVGLVLLIACANLANLLLARASSRSAELAVRTALGASRGRLVRQILTESLLLAVIGGTCGVLLASWGTQLLLAAMPDVLPRLEGVGIDGRVVAFTGVLSLLTGVAFGILPAWKASSRNLAPGLSGPRGQAGMSSGRLRNAFVVAEIAVAMVLLVAAGLLLHALWRLNSVRPGFAPEGRVAARLDLPESRYGDIPAQTQFRERVLAELHGAPGVAAAMISEVPLTGQALNHNFVIEGRPPIAIGDEPELYSRSVMGDYFGVMGIPRKTGRDLSPSDREGTPLVGVVNESFVRQYFPGASPVGARIRWARDEEVHWIEIVGVVGDVRHFGLAHGDEPAVYTPYAQSSQAWKRWMEVVVRGPRDATGTAGLAALLREKVHAVDPLIPVPGARSLDSIVTSSLGSERFRTQLLTLFAGLALLLASVGIAGVMSQSVRQRTAEIGVRMALGAEPSRVVGGLLAEGMKLTALGLLIGVGGALAASRVLSSFLYGIGATDPATYAAVALLLAAVRRSGLLDPGAARGIDRSDAGAAGGIGESKCAHSLRTCVTPSGCSRSLPASRWWPSRRSPSASGRTRPSSASCARCCSAPFPIPSRSASWFPTSTMNAPAAWALRGPTSWTGGSTSARFRTSPDTGGRSWNVSGTREPELLRGAEISAPFLSLLGVRPALGRDFQEADDRPGAERTALISRRDVASAFRLGSVDRREADSARRRSLSSSSVCCPAASPSSRNRWLCIRRSV